MNKIYNYFASLLSWKRKPEQTGGPYPDLFPVHPEHKHLIEFTGKSIVWGCKKCGEALWDRHLGGCPVSDEEYKFKLILK